MMKVEKAPSQKRFQVLNMEGPIARWYTQQRGSAPQLAGYRRQAAQLASGLEPGTEILEVAPGPGYFAIEMARLGFRVTGVDLSRTFVGIASVNARRAGVNIEFRQGDATRLPFGAESFDFVACQAAFKNFPEPVTALDEMYRVLRTGRSAVIHDMSREATRADIRREVAGMELGRFNGFMTRRSLTMLRLRAFSPHRFEQLAAASAFGGCSITSEGIGLEVRLTKA